MFPSRLSQSQLRRFPFDKVPKKKKEKKRKNEEAAFFEISMNQDTQVICKHYAVGWPKEHNPRMDRTVTNLYYCTSHVTANLSRFI